MPIENFFTVIYCFVLKNFFLYISNTVLKYTPKFSGLSCFFPSKKILEKNLFLGLIKQDTPLIDSTEEYFVSFEYCVFV